VSRLTQRDDIYWHSVQKLLHRGGFTNRVCEICVFVCSCVQSVCICALKTKGHLIPGTFLHVLFLTLWVFSLRLLPKLPSNHTCSFGKQLTFRGLDKLQEMTDRIGLTTVDSLTIEDCNKFNCDISGRRRGEMIADEVLGRVRTGLLKE
jgi:hypothetical protein